jgi:hypothetical protein
MLKVEEFEEFLRMVWKINKKPSLKTPKESNQQPVNKMKVLHLLNTRS